jgi:hypothetical protein
MEIEEHRPVACAEDAHGGSADVDELLGLDDGHDRTIIP